MSNLISRSALIKEIESLTIRITGLRCGKGALTNFAKEYKELILQIINEQPAAYDIDKVIEAIKREPRSYPSNLGCSAISEVYAIRTKRAVDIVQNGGTDDEAYRFSEIIKGGATF